jgi:hypothetical protein
MSRTIPASLFLPSATNPRERTMNQAITDMYRVLSERLLSDLTSGLFAARPASDGSNRFFYATDTGDIYFDAPAGWALVNLALSNGQTFTLLEAHGAKVEIKTLREVLTTSATPSSTTANLLPANSLILDVSVRVTTGLIGTLTTFQVGDSAKPTRFATAIAKAINTTAVGLSQWTGQVGIIPSQPADAKVYVSATSGTLTGGVVEIIVHAIVFTPPTS